MKKMFAMLVVGGFLAMATIGCGPAASTPEATIKSTTTPASTAGATTTPASTAAATTAPAKP